MSKAKTEIEAGTPTDIVTDSASPRVGYRNPPTRTRFKRGRSGNRKGRPTGSRNYCVNLEHVLKESVKLPDGRVKLELTRPCENEEGRKYGYLVVPRKLPRDEWEKVAQRALKHNMEPDPRFKRPEETVILTRKANR